METLQSRQEIGRERPVREKGERTYWKVTLGAPELCTSTNSLAPFRGFLTGRVEEPAAFGQRPHRDINAGNVLLFWPSDVDPYEEQDLARSQKPPAAFHERGSSAASTFQSLSGIVTIWRTQDFRECAPADLSPSETWRELFTAPHHGRHAAQERQALSAVRQSATEQPLVPVSRVEFAAGVSRSAAAEGVSEELRTVSGLCLALIPLARRVLVTITRDPEDGQTGFRFSVFTQASVEAVVDAEDRLHEALFQRVDPSKVTKFSIVYEFLH